jgi:AAA domain, putative AbiEii toxin, Type IV TA system
MIHKFILDEVVPHLGFDVTLEPNKQVYCFIGKNGVGKTKMLEGLAKAVLYCHSIFEKYDKTTKFSGRFMLQQVYERFTEETIRLPYRSRVRNLLDYTYTDFTGTRIALDSIVKRTKHNNEFRCDRPLVFINAKGRGYLESLEKTNSSVKDLFSGGFERRFASELRRLFDAINGKETSGEDVVLWLARRTILNVSWQSNHEIMEGEILTLFRILQTLEPSWEIIVKETVNTSQIGIWYNHKSGKIMVNQVPIDALSTGYSSILRMFQEIISGYGAWVETGDVSQVEGIVFIDEIESHLHAEWQSRIIPLLKKSFPKTTFYIATHAPLIVATTDRDEAYELVKNEESGYVEAKKLGNPRGWYLADMLETAFHVDIDSVRNGSAGDVGARLREFSGKVKEYQKAPSPDLKLMIEEIYKNLQNDLAESDPRRRSAAALRELVE